jgi:hypothetical protein
MSRSLRGHIMEHVDPTLDLLHHPTMTLLIMARPLELWWLVPAKALPSCLRTLHLPSFSLMPLLLP